MPDLTVNEVHGAIRAVVAYNWSDEQRDYEEQDEDGQRGHIFNSLHTLSRYLDRHA